MKTLKPYMTYMPDGESQTRTVIIPLRSAERKAAIANHASRHAFVNEALERGIVAEYGCRCRACMNDWDCCGNMVPSSIVFIPVRKGIKLVQYYYLNI